MTLAGQSSNNEARNNTGTLGAAFCMRLLQNYVTGV
jgi:hypothetical protein